MWYGYNLLCSNIGVEQIQDIKKPDSSVKLKNVFSMFFPRIPLPFSAIPHGLGIWHSSVAEFCEP